MATKPHSTDAGFGVSFIYVIGADDGVVKIGKADDPKFRLSQFQIAHHVDIRLVYAREVPKERAYDAENAAHNALSKSHIRGEHFRVSEAEAIAAVDAAVAAVEAGARGAIGGKPTPKPKALVSLGGAVIPRALNDDIRSTITAGRLYSRDSIVSFLVRKGVPFSHATKAARKIMADYADLSESAGKGARKLIDGTVIGLGHFLKG